MVIPRTNPSNKRLTVPVAGTSVAGQNLMGQRSGIGCDVVTVAVTGETGKSLMGQRSGIGCDTRRSLMGSEDNKCNQNYQRPKEDETLECIMKKAGFGVNVATNGNFRNGPFALAKRVCPPSFGSKVKPLSSEESIKLFASQSRKRPHSDSSHGNLLRVEKERDERQTNQSELFPVMQRSQIPDVLTPREKVLMTLHRFNMVFEDLDKDKATRRSSRQTDRCTWDILMSDMNQVNGEKRVGVVPGVAVGDEFRYKSQLNIIGLHFKMSGGIDYMYKEGLAVATSIVISEGAAYKDACNSDVVIYCGEGDYLKRKNLKQAQDQKMTRGNLALANSMKAKTHVRLIIGKKMMDHREKRYVYAGLYSVMQYWDDKGPLGNQVFKFKLLRLPGQDSIHLNY